MRLNKYLVLLFCLCPVWARAAEVSPDWLALGHYQHNISTIDSPEFFLAPNGKTNPQAELDATIALFEGSDVQRQCLFPARYLWLKKQNLIRKPFPHCAEYEQFQKDLQPSGVTLLFTDAYMNNPSSMFGHTLLRIDTKRKGTQLLAHGANYGAFTGEEGGALYALRGLTGGYYGGFTVKPYYDIINTYNNIENRDIWELNLDFTPQELDFFVAHLWEIGQTRSRYFFFSRNCSYMLMEMLDAVRPSLHLAQRFPAHAIPLDTFKAAARAENLVKGVNYRPSRQNKIRHRYQMMTEQQKQSYRHAVTTQDFALPDSYSPAEKADIWETAYQYIQYQYVAKKIELDDYRRQSFDLLRARSQVKEPGTIDELYEGRSPLKAHESMQIQGRGGVKNGEFFEELRYRPAYQSLADNDYGLLHGAEINFLDSRWRHYDQQNKYVLQNFDLVRIRSVAPVDFQFQPLSFQLNLSLDRWQNPYTEDEGYIGNVGFGSGGAIALGNHIQAFTLFDSSLVYGGVLPHQSYIALGPDIGLLASFGKFHALAEVKPQWASQKLGQQITYKAELDYGLSTNLSVVTEETFRKRPCRDDQELAVGLKYYF